MIKNLRPIELPKLHAFNYEYVSRSNNETEDCTENWRHPIEYRDALLNTEGALLRNDDAQLNTDGAPLNCNGALLNTDGAILNNDCTFTRFS